jgi:N-acetylmuramoyl-L-alanine amidase
VPDAPRTARTWIAALATVTSLATSLVLLGGVPTASAAPAGSVRLGLTTAAMTGQTRASALPLAGRTVVVDPGHQLGNSRFPRQVNRPVDAGGFTKPCNTTGTATNAGYPEATFAWRVAKQVRKQLQALGATVVMTRSANSVRLWGPCVDVRGKLGNRGYAGRTTDADLKLSIHGDGSSAANHGFHVIVATKKSGLRASTRYATDTRAALQKAGFVRSTYIGRGTALSFRGDLGTLNFDRMPAVMVELGNMRNRSDAASMTSASGQTAYASALTAAARTFLTS